MHARVLAHTQRRDRRCVSSGGIRRNLNDQFSPLHGHCDISDIRNQWRASSICLFHDDKHHIQTVLYWSQWLSGSRKCGIGQACPSLSYRSVFVKGLDKIGGGRGGEYQVNHLRDNSIIFSFTFYLPIIFISPTTQRNIFGRFERKKESEMMRNEMVVIEF